MNSSMLLLAEIGVTHVVLGAVAGIVAGALAGYLLCQSLAGKSLSRAKSEAAQIVERAGAEARTQADAVRIEAERQALARKQQFEKEAETARAELREVERRLTKREDLMDRKEETIAQRESSSAKQAESIRAREEKLQAKEAQVTALVEQQTQKLHQIADLSRDQAREELLQRIEQDCRLDVAKLTRKITEQAEEDAAKQAREITLMAIQRYATEHTSESTVRTVAIPSDDMKGRIIGREGRNIRAFEQAAGVNIIVDDTPGVIVVSCFDKVRQAIAVEALERLVADGRMHPARIEEIIEKVKKEINESIMKFGKDAIVETNLRAMHPKIVEAMGKLYYRTSYGQNVLRHSVEVAYLSQIIAEQLGLDGAIARRCGFLHDIGKAMDHEMEGGHPKIGMDFAKQYGEKDPVLNVIGGHHGDIPSTTFYTPIIMAADAVSSARPGARRESMERYVQRLTQLQDIALGFKGVTEAYAIQAGREVRVMLDAARVGDDEAYLIAHQIAKRVSDEMTFPGEIKVTVLRETRAIEVAR